MYAYGSVFIERPSVRALPVSAITQIGNQTYCYLVWTAKRCGPPCLPASATAPGSMWRVSCPVSPGHRMGPGMAFDEAQPVIVGDLAELSDGLPVQVDSGTNPEPKGSAAKGE